MPHAKDSPTFTLNKELVGWRHAASIFWYQYLEASAELGSLCDELSCLKICKTDILLQKCFKSGEKCIGKSICTKRAKGQCFVVLFMPFVFCFYMNSYQKNSHHHWGKNNCQQNLRTPSCSTTCHEWPLIIFSLYLNATKRTRIWANRSFSLQHSKGCCIRRRLASPSSVPSPEVGWLDVTMSYIISAYLRTDIAI